MNGESYNLFYTLVKLKFYLVSLLDTPQENKTFYFTEEFLERRLPERKKEIIDILNNYGVSSDSDIAFDDSVILKFKEIVKEKEQHINLTTILHNLDIESNALSRSSLDQQRSDREKQAHTILENLFQLSTNWVMHKEIENKFEDYSILDEEDVIRPEETEKLDVLNSNTTSSFEIITQLTIHYIDLLADYYFKYGGDIQLKEFWQDLEKIKKDIQIRYKELFRSSGLDTGGV